MDTSLKYLDSYEVVCLLNQLIAKLLEDVEEANDKPIVGIVGDVIQVKAPVPETKEKIRPLRKAQDDWFGVICIRQLMEAMEMPELIEAQSALREIGLNLRFEYRMVTPTIRCSPETLRKRQLMLLNPLMNEAWWSDMELRDVKIMLVPIGLDVEEAADFAIEGSIREFVADNVNMAKA